MNPFINQVINNGVHTTKKRVANKGLAPQYYVEDDHEAIIPKDLFLRVQEEMARRASLETNVGRRRLFSSRYALSNTVFCAHCGEVFQRIQWTHPNGKKFVWRCISRLRKKRSAIDCPARTLNEAELHAVVLKAVNEVYAKQDNFIPQFKANVEKALMNSNSPEIEAIDEKIAVMEAEIIKRSKTRQNCDELGDEIIKLREERYKLQLDDANKEGLKEKIAELHKFLDGQSAEVHEYDDSLVRRLIETITVYDDHFKVLFKFGIEVEVAA